MERMLGGRDAKPVSEGETVAVSAAEPFGAIEFVRFHRKHYIGEVGKKGVDYIYHFFPIPSYNTETPEFPKNFADKLGDAFNEVFKIHERVEASFTEELNSWAVRVSGYAGNPLADDLALKVFDVLDRVVV
jgi:hypothetical protein